MTTDRNSTPRSRGALLDWLVRVNTEVSHWASSMSWWRLILLFLLLLIAGSIIGDLLHLKHDRVRIVQSGDEKVITIGGKNGIRIVQGPHGKSVVVPPAPPASAATPVPPVPPDADSTDAEDAIDKAAEKAAAAVEKSLEGLDNEDSVVNRQVATFRGVLGDLGG